MEAGDYQGYLLGDLGYALCHYLMTPIQSSRSDAEKKKGKLEILLRDFSEYGKKVPNIKKWTP